MEAGSVFRLFDRLDLEFAFAVFSLIFQWLQGQFALRFQQCPLVKRTVETFGIQSGYLKYPQVFEFGLVDFKTDRIGVIQRQHQPHAALGIGVEAKRVAGLPKVSGLNALPLFS